MLRIFSASLAIGIAILAIDYRRLGFKELDLVKYPVITLVTFLVSHVLEKSRKNHDH